MRIVWSSSWMTSSTSRSLMLSAALGRPLCYCGKWQECKITLQNTRPCYAKSSYRSVDPQTLYGNVHQADHVPNGPTNYVVTTMFPLRLCGGKPPVAVTRERRYGPSRLRVNDDDDVLLSWSTAISTITPTSPATDDWPWNWDKVIWSECRCWVFSPLPMRRLLSIVSRWLFVKPLRNGNRVRPDTGIEQTFSIIVANTDTKRFPAVDSNIIVSASAWFGFKTCKHFDSHACNKWFHLLCCANQYTDYTLYRCRTPLSSSFVLLQIWPTSQ